MIKKIFDVKINFFICKFLLSVATANYLDQFFRAKKAAIDNHNHCHQKQGLAGVYMESL